MSGVLANLVNDEKQRLQVTSAIEKAIARSLVTHPMAHLTHSEVKRRFDLCVTIFVRLRGDLGWGIVRALDRMPEYFEAELNGVAWAPDERSCWMPGDDGSGP